MNTPRLSLSLALSLVASAASAQVMINSTVSKLASPTPVQLVPVPPPAPAPAPMQKAVTTAMPVPLPVMKTDVMPKLAIPAMEPSQTLAPMRPSIQPSATLTPLTTKAMANLPGQAADAPGVKIAPGLNRADAKGPNLRGAKIDVSDLKQDIKLDGLGQSGKGMDGVRAKMMGLGGGEGAGGGLRAGLGGEDGKVPGKASVLGGGKTVGSGAGSAITDAVGEGGPIEGSKYGDTFGGKRVNGKQQGSKNNFAGNGKGKTSQGGDEEGGAPAGTIAQMLTDSGGKPSGDVTKDATELQYAMSVGSDGYAATKNMSSEERKGYWEAEKNSQLVGSGRPREDDMGKGGGPMGRQEIKTQERGLAGIREGAGGSGDGRTDQQAGGGSNGQMIARGLAGSAEREEGVGTLNMDAALKINQVARPVENQ